jgi:hypothetical protein
VLFRAAKKALHQAIPAPLGLRTKIGQKLGPAGLKANRADLLNRECQWAVPFTDGADHTL